MRFFVLLLLLANGAYFAWAQGFLAGVGLAPAVQTEPQRIPSQIKPDAIRLLNPAETRRVETLAGAPASKPTECLQSALLSDVQTAAVRKLLDASSASLPASLWSLKSVTEPARWIIYMGKYPDAQALDKKKGELRALGISFENLKNTELEPGLSLGGHASQAAADEAMAQLAKRGVRTATVLQETPERSGYALKLPAVDDALRVQIEPVRALLGAGALATCQA